jgi:hypothetical protein
VVHEVRHARDAFGGDVEAVDYGRLAARGRWNGDRARVVDVERQPYRDAAMRRVYERAGDEPRGRLVEVEVVQGEIEGLLRARDELADELGDLEGALAPIRQCAYLDRQA